MSNTPQTLQRQISIFVGVAAAIVCGLALALRAPAGTATSSPVNVLSATDLQQAPLVASSPALPAEPKNDSSPVRGEAATPRFERSNEPPNELDSVNAHGG